MEKSEILETHQRINKFDSEEKVAEALAKYISNLSSRFICHKHCFTIVLSGGSLIDTLRKLLEPPYIHNIKWSKWHVFFLDERVVPLDHKDSNYKLAYDGFLSKVPIPSDQIYSINDTLSAEDAADDYEARIKDLVHKGILKNSHKSGFPKFDLMLLGMGPEGHVASLFCWMFQRYEKERYVTFIKDSPKPPSQRITFSFPLINSSSFIALVITGEEVADAVKVALGSSSAVHIPLPVEKVAAEDFTTWFLDKDACSGLC